MKTINIKNTGMFLLLFCCSFFMFNAKVYATNAPGVAVMDFESIALAKINHQLTGLAMLINNGIALATNSLVKMTSDLIFSFDAIMPYVMADNQKLAAAEKNTEPKVDNYLGNIISDFFSGSANADNIDTKPPLAQDDMPQDQSSSPSLLSSIFSSGSSPVSKEKYLQGNAIFNIYQLLADNTAGDDDVKNFDAALKYIDPISNLKALKLGTSFKITFSPTNSPTGTLIKTDEKSNDKSLKALQLYLSQQPSYQKYKHAYRSLLAQRLWYLSNIIEPFEKRVPASKNDKSIAQIEDDQVSRYQQDAYYREIAKAPIGTLLRENLIVNTKLLAEIHKLRLETEKARVLAAISSLQNMGLTSMNLNNQLETVEKCIYHQIVDSKVPCGASQSGAAAITEQVEQAGFAPSLPGQKKEK